jgi:predicted transcriptional regulator
MNYFQKPSGTAEGEQNLSKRVMSRRSKLELRMDILRAIMDGAEGPTQIMYMANLSWILLCDHLVALNEQGFVAEKSLGNRKKYALTDRGTEIVGAYLNLIREIVFETAAPPI